MNIIQRIIKKINRNIGHYLRARYSSFIVARPYIITQNNGLELKGKVAVVTGGSGAIGRAISFRLAAEGAYVYVCGTKIENAKSVVNEIVNFGFSASPVELNVLEASSIEKVFTDIASKHEGHIDILVNSAGGSARDKCKEFRDQDIEVIDKILNVNLRGAMICSQVASKFMIGNRYGRIINITSVIGLQGKYGLCEYAASKGGSIAFVKSLAQELGQYGITVNGVSPGIVARGEILPEQSSRLLKTNWMNDLGKPEDISAVVNFLCRQESSFITGQNIAADGGRSLGLKEV